MAEYRTLKPISVTVEGGVQHYPRPGTLVELDADQAAPLLLAERIESAGEPVVVADPAVEPVQTAEDVAAWLTAEAAFNAESAATASKRRGSRGGEGDGQA